jgi:hypothetical protein
MAVPPDSSTPPHFPQGELAGFPPSEREYPFHNQSISPFPSSDSQQRLERDWLVTVPELTDLMIYFVFVALQSDFVRFQPTYDAMLKSLRF